MTVEHILAFNFAVLAAIASPGPALLVAIRTTLTSGRRAGLAVGAGLGLVAALWTLAALLGLEALFKIFPWGPIRRRKSAAPSIAKRLNNDSN